MATVELTRGATVEDREILVIGDGESTNGIARVLDTGPASTDWAVVTRQVGYSTTVNVSSLAGPVIVRSSAADHLVTVYQSTAANLQATVAQASTVWAVQQGGYVAPSTITAVSSVSGLVTVAPQGTSNSTIYFPVRLTNGTAFLTPGTDYADGSTASGIAGPTLTFDNGTNVTMRAVSLTLGFPVNVVAGSAASTIVTVSTGSVRVHQSTAADLNVTVAGYSTIVSVSTGSVRVHQSTAADLNVTVAGYSTTVNISSLAGPVIVRSSAADQLVTVYQSTAAALNATVVPGSTTWTVQARLTTSSGGALDGSTAAPAQGVLALPVREAFSTCQSTTAAFTSSNSTAVYAVVASVASMRHFVSAYAVFASTSGNPSTLVFMSSLAIDRWAVGLSSGFSGANMAVSQSGWIFRTDAQNALNLRIESASTAIQARVSLTYFTEP